MTEDPLKVSHFAFSDTGGGAARAAYRLHTALLAQGVNGRMFVLRKQRDDPTVASVMASGTWARMVLSEFAPRLDLAPLRAVYPGSRAFWSPGWFSSMDPRKLPGLLESDLISLYWITRGLLSIRDVGRLLSLGKPVVWRLSDMWPFTGGCHYSGNCERFTGACGSCPQLGSSSNSDLSSILLRWKRRAWKHGRLTVVAPSNWMAQIARRSSLLRARDIRVIHTGVDTALFRPIEKRAAREILGLPKEGPLLLYGATSALSDPRKGAASVTAVIEALARSSQASGANAALVLFGTSKRPAGLPQSVPVFPLGTIRDETMLAVVYSACDVFLAPSREENLPNTVLEAMACGLPCVAYRVGGTPEAISHGVSGHLAAPRDTADLAQGVATIIRDSGLRRAYSAAARARAVADFDLARQAQRYVELYRELVSQLR